MTECRQEVTELSWSQIREQTLKRDDYTCKRCGKVEKECDRSLDVHHRLPKSKGGTDDLEKLITLCSPCHGSEEPRYPRSGTGEQLTRIMSAHSKTESMRITIPQQIANELGWQIEDHLVWHTEKGETFARVKKLEIQHD